MSLMLMLLLRQGLLVVVVKIYVERMLRLDIDILKVHKLRLRLSCQHGRYNQSALDVLLRVDLRSFLISSRLLGWNFGDLGR